MGYDSNRITVFDHEGRVVYHADGEGNTLVCSGAQGWVFEVTPDQRVVWDWKNPFGYHESEEKADEDDEVDPTALFRAMRYAADHPGVVALREKGAQIPAEPGEGPATNQRVDPPEESEEPEPEPGADDGDGTAR